MKTMLIFPPGWNPCSPYLALPVLKAYLDHQGHSVTLMDSNVEFFDYILTPNYLKECLSKEYIKNNTKKINATLKMFSGCIDEIEDAKKTMRSKKYLLPDERKWVDTVLTNALYIVNNTTEGLNISFNKMELKYSRTSSQEVFNACFDNIRNPYIDFFTKNVISRINNSQIKCVGISITGHTQLISALTLCKLVKEKCPSVCHITLGGNYITRVVEQICSCHLFDHGFFDSIMLYDGEIPFNELLNSLQSNSSLDIVHNLVFMREGKYVHTELSSSNDINSFPPDFSGLPLEKYFTPAVVFPIYTSRSCYNKCEFCTIPYATSGHYRAMCIENVLQNITKLIEKYDAKFFVIVDETFDVKRMVRLANAILSANLKIYWYCETRFSNELTPENCTILYKSGCRQIQFGLESYNQRVLDKMSKNIKIDWIDSSVTNCMKAGISVHMFFFTGFPTETYEEALETYKYTSQKVTESQLKYNVATSRGYGTFGLDIGSGVWMNPEKFGVNLIPNDSTNDLRLYVDYSVKDGLTQEECEKIVQSQKLRDGITSRVATDYELPWMDFVPEVHMVVRAALCPNIETKPLRKMLSDSILLDLIKKNTIRIPQHISITYFEEKTFFYDRHTNKAYVIPSSYLYREIPKYSFFATEVFNLSIKEVIKHFQNMIFYTFIIVDNYEDETFSDLNENTKLVKSDCIFTFYNEDSNEWVISNRTSGHFVVVNELSRYLLDLFLQPLTFHELTELLKANSIILSLEHLHGLIRYYIDHDILHALAI